MEARLHSNREGNLISVFQDLNQLMQSFNDRQANRSFSAPCEVPGGDSKVESADGWVGQDEVT